MWGAGLQTPHDTLHDRVSARRSGRDQFPGCAHSCVSNDYTPARRAICLTCVCVYTHTLQCYSSTRAVLASRGLRFLSFIRFLIGNSLYPKMP